MKNNIIIIIMVSIIFCLFNAYSTLLSEEPVKLEKKQYTWKIDKEDISLPFEEYSGIWHIIPSDLAPEHFVLTQKLKYIDFTKYLSEQPFYDFTFTSKMYIAVEDIEKFKEIKKKKKSDDPEENDERESVAAGLIFRYRDSFKYYMLFLDAMDEEIVLIKNNFGKDIIKKVPFSLEPNKWYTLSIRCYLKNISVDLDGKMIFSLSDTTATGGKIGFSTYRQTTAYFNDINVDTEIIQETEKPSENETAKE